MGVDLVVYIRKDQIRKLLDLDSSFSFWDDFYYLLKMPIRWYTFQEWVHWDKDEPLTSKQLLTHLARVNKKVENRGKLVEICSNYDLLFAPDFEKVGEEWVDVVRIEDTIQKLVKKHFDEFISLLEGENED